MKPVVMAIPVTAIIAHASAHDDDLRPQHCEPVIEWYRQAQFKAYDCYHRHTSRGKTKMNKVLVLVCLIVSITPSSHAQVEGDYVQFARESRDQNDSVLRAVEMITYASDESARAAGLKDLEQFAARGSVHAAFQLAIGSFVGAHGVPVNLDRSRRYFEFSVRQESLFALFDYGLMLLSGHRFEADADRGQALIARAAELGHPAARVLLIEQLQAAGDDQSHAKADAWRQSMGATLSADGRYTEDPDYREAQVAYGYAQLSEYFTDNVRVPADAERARLYLSKVPEEIRGDVFADIATRYAAVTDIEADHARAKALFERELEFLGAWGLNNYAWLLSTSPDAAVRNGELAVTIMEEVLANETRRPSWVDTLAAAYAETGNFSRAIELQDEALPGFEEDSFVFATALQRRAGYEEGRAWRE